MRVIAIDPGESFGLAVANVTDALRVEHFGIVKAKRFLLGFYEFAHDFDFVIYERYTVRADKLEANVGTSVPTLQYIGMIRFCAWQAQLRRGDGRPTLVDQAPSLQTKGIGAAKVLSPGEYYPIIKDGYDGPHDEGHHASALAHLFAWYYDLTLGDPA